MANSVPPVSSYTSSGDSTLRGFRYSDSGVAGAQIDQRTDDFRNPICPQILLFQAGRLGENYLSG